jgi:hypothetical protein
MLAKSTTSRRPAKPRPRPDPGPDRPARPSPDAAAMERARALIRALLAAGEKAKGGGR